jgi:hypothetical protein
VNQINELKEMILKLHGVETVHIESVPIKEKFHGQTVWEGIVEVFDLIDHPQAPKAYAWSHDTDDPGRPRRHVTVLHSEPVISAITAVRAAIVQEFRNGENTEEV